MDVAKNFTREVVDLPEGGLVVCPQLLNTIVNVATQIGTRDGHLVLIGSPGSGRRTAVQLAAYSQHLEISSPSVSSLNDKVRV